MIVSIYLEDHDYLINKPQTFNFGGKYLYSFQESGNELLVKRRLNDKYIPDFFNISGSNCKVDLLSAIVGQNGVGKSSVLDIIRRVFVKHSSYLAYANSTVLVELDGEIKVLYSSFSSWKIIDESGSFESYIKLDKVDPEKYQSIYYSPHLDLKYSSDFDNIDNYNISLDQYIIRDLECVDEKGTNEAGWKFPLHEELVFKNSMRQIEFLNSSVFKENQIFREVFNLPEYKKGILYFRDVIIPKVTDSYGFPKVDFHNTPSQFRTIIELILKKIGDERDKWGEIIERDANGEVVNQVKINKYLLERFVIRAFVSIIIQQMEKQNTWLSEGEIENSYDESVYQDYSAKELFLYFIKESYIKDNTSKRNIFDYEEVTKFFDKLDNLFEKETKSNNIGKQSIRLGLDELKEVLQLHKKVINNLLYYYPTRAGLIETGDYIDGFLAFRPTDRNMSSGETALLNFFSKLYSFVQDNLIEDNKTLPDKENYVLLLDEADLGFHPVWKKKYINAILKTLPYFFDSLKVKPNLQIIITTHDPLTLSDLPVNNVVFLQKDKEYCSVISDEDQAKVKKTFGANITDLLAHSFFIDDGLIGDFSKSKINEVIDWINESKKLPKEKYNSSKFKEDLESYKKVINLIDEKVIKMKLAEMITDLVSDNDYYNQLIEEEIEMLRNKKK